FERRESPFTCPAMLDERSLHVVHSVPLGVRLPTGEPVWLGLRQNFAAWDGYKREVYVQGIFTLALVGVVGGALGIFVVRVRREHELQLARDRAQAANHAKSEFIAFVSHELRTPLQSVIGYADILRGRPDHPARNEYLDALAAQGRDLLEVVNELLDFSAAEAGRLTLNVSEFSLHEVIDDCARVVAPDVHAKRLRWEVSIDRSVPPGVSGDRARVRQVLLNVIGNAVKFTDCGSVTVKAERVEPATTERTNSIGPNPPPAPVAIRFVVLDTGPGIPELERSRLFEVFGRLDDKVRGGKTGSGVGLALSRKLSALMGGTIALENRSDGVAGAVATVVMSFAGASDVYVSPHRESQPEGIGDDTSRLPAVDRPSPARGVDRKTRPVRILLAEDHPHVREVVCEMLASLGCAVNTTDNGLEATTLAREGDYDVILLDTWMPGMSGMQVAREIHATLPNDSRPWLIGISASSRPEDRAACVAAGMNDFLAKPIDCAALRAALQRSGRTPSDSELPESATVDAAGVAAPEREWKSLFGANFEEETTAIVVSLARAVEIGDWQLVHQRAHYLENSAVWVRQDDVAACCATLGQAVRAGDHDGARAALGRLRDTRRQHRAREETS
ncbi:MAG: response regulator, partial [Opitutaceae bacterium]